MVIEKGKDWGEAAPLPPDGVIVDSDAEARLVVDRFRRQQEPVPPLGLVGGDLWRTLGGLGDRARLATEDATRFTVDLGAVLLDGRRFWFVSSLQVRKGGWWRGKGVLVMNSQWLGPWNVAPRAHPNDGVLDVVRVDLPLGERQKVWRRLPTGTHLPHPGIRTERTSATQIELPEPHCIHLDGQVVGLARTISVRTEPDALVVHV